MTFVRWIEAYHVGIAQLDAEHKQLIAMMNELYESMLSGHAAIILDTVLDGLIAYGEDHLRHEEEMFARTDYPLAAAHTRLHDSFRKQVQELKRHARTATGRAVALETLTYLKDWLIRHIEKTDREFADYLAAKGIRSAGIPA